MTVFDIKRDNELIAVGSHFWCQGCLVARPLDDHSPDPRYCLMCYEFLSKEAAMLNKWKLPDWVPKPQRGEETTGDIPQHSPRIMSTVADRKSRVDIIRPSVGGITRKKRGPKHRELPEEVIKELSEQGLGSKAISTRLRETQGIEVSYKTIQRILSGQRVLV